MSLHPFQDGAPPVVTWTPKALLVADMVDSVRLMRARQEAMVTGWRAFVAEVSAEVLPLHGGRFVKSYGDGFLLDFDSVPAAAAAALDIQRRVRAGGAAAPQRAEFSLRVGVHHGDVVLDAIDDYGHAVNLTQRLSTLAGPGEIVVSAEVHGRLLDGVDAELEDLGECFVRSLDEPLRAYRLGPAASGAANGLTSRRLNEVRPSIAVLPFASRSADDPGDLLGEAIADEVTACIARSPHWHVISGLSTRALKGRQLEPAALARHLDAAYVLTGHYRLAGGQVRLQLELCDMRTQRAAWADLLEAPVAGLFEPGADLTERIVSGLARSILAQELERANTLPMPALESYTLLFAAISLMHRSSAGEFERSRLMLEHLAERQGRRGLAHAWLAKWHVLRMVQGWSTDADAEVAMALDRVRRALDADPHDGLALAIGGLVHGYLRKDLGEAGRLYAQALSSNPNEPLAWLFSATWHAWRDEGQAAEEAADMALRLSPLDPLKYFFDSLAATAVLSNGQHERAIALARRSLRANRTHASTYRTLAIAQALHGDLTGARQTVLDLQRVEPGLTASGFLRRYPGRDARHAASYAHALREAGVPD